ncbi:hypothetical protein ABG067_004544 [Albugo candida]
MTEDKGLNSRRSRRHQVQGDHRANVRNQEEQAESDEHGEGRSMETREKVSSVNCLNQEECINVEKLETSAEELQVSDPVIVAFAVLPVEQAHGRKIAIPDPKNYGAAHREIASTRLAVAVQEELASLEANETWTVIKCPIN